MLNRLEDYFRELDGMKARDSGNPESFTRIHETADGAAERAIADLRAQIAQLNGRLTKGRLSVEQLGGER